MLLHAVEMLAVEHWTPPRVGGWEYTGPIFRAIEEAD
jgi:hypothetical protein